MDYGRRPVDHPRKEVRDAGHAAVVGHAGARATTPATTTSRSGILPRICGLLAILATGDLNDLEPVIGLFLAFFWLHNIVDAGRRASFYNQALAGLRPMELPEDGKAPQQVFGSLAGGVLLIVAGLTLFANTMFRIPLDWLAQWWPLALVGAGAWLIYADRRAKAAAAGAEPTEL